MAEGCSDISIMDKVLSNSLQCSICLETLKSPRALTCLHSFCEDCLQTLINAELQDVFHDMQVTCPSCRAITDLSAYRRMPRNKLAKQLPLNFMIMSIIDDLNDVKNIKAAKEIQRVRARVIEHNDEVENCREHRGQKLRLFCRIHNRILCKNCAKRDHKHCRPEKLTDIVNEEYIQNKGQEVTDGVNKTTTEITQSITALARNKEELEAEIDSYPATIQTLELQLKKLIGKVQKNIANTSEETKKKATDRQEELLSDCTSWLAALEMINTEYSELRDKGTPVQRFITTVNMENELQLVKTISKSVKSAVSTVQVQQELIEVLKSVVKIGEDMLSTIHIRA